jgi:hypothetical protein
MKLSKHCWVVISCTAACATAALFGAGPWLRLALAILALTAIGWAILYGTIMAHPAETLLVIWCIPASLHFARLMYPGHSWPDYPLLYLVGFLCCYLLGFYSLRAKRVRRIAAPSRGSTLLDSGGLRRREWLYDTCALLGLISAVCAILSGAAYSGGSYSDMGSVRHAYMSATPTIWAYVVLVTQPAAVVAFVVGFLYQERLSVRRRYIYMFAGMTTVVSGVVSAGRYTAVQIVLLTGICIAIRRANHLPAFADARLRTLVSMVTTGLLIYMLAIPYLRDRSGQTGVAEFAIAEGIQVDPEFVDTVWSLNPSIRDALYETYIYLAIPIENFRVFYYVYAGTPQYGAFEQGTITRRIANIFPQVQTFEANLVERDSEFHQAGESGASWQTLVRDAVIDYGWIGCLLFAFALGAFGRFVYARAASGPSIPVVLALVGTCFISAHSIMYSVIGVPSVLVLIMWGAVVQLTRGHRPIGSIPFRNRYPRSMRSARPAPDNGARIRGKINAGLPL